MTFITLQVLFGSPTTDLAVAFSLHLRSRVFVKAACGKTARAVWAADEASAQARLLRADNGAVGLTEITSAHPSLGLNEQAMALYLTAFGIYRKPACIAMTSV